MAKLTETQMKYWLEQFCHQFSGWTIDEQILALEYFLRILKERQAKGS